MNLIVIQRPLITLLCSAVLLTVSGISCADEDEKGVATAPAGTDVFETTFEGTWFVERKLKKQYDALLVAVSDLENRVRQGDLDVQKAQDEIAGLRESLEDVRRQIDDRKTLVSPFKIVTQEVEGTIELGAERLLVVIADRIKIIGWDQPHLKYVMARKVLSTGTPVDKHLAAVRVIHENRVATNLVGRTDHEMTVWRDGFLAAKDGEEQTAEQLKQKEDSWQRYFAHGERFRPFLGKMVDVLHIEGLTWQEGNQHISYELLRPEGGGQYGSRWRRNADVTLFVPKCTAVLLRGCQMGIDVSGLETHLMLTAMGSQNRDYDGQFAIRNHTGDITYSNVPMDVIEHVAGNVNITAATEMANTGSHHSGGNWTLHTPAPRRLMLSDISGTLTARFTRSDLHVDAIAGVLNIRNDFGDTHCSIHAALIPASHRIVSQSGLVNVEVDRNTELMQPVFVATSCGTIATSLGRSKLDDLNVTFTSGRDGLRHEWRSLHSKLPQGDFSARSALHQRPDDILENSERTHGLDLLSVAGRVEYLVEGR
ncbi:MAG: hypothetical protein ABGZ53_15945 [Fuerstiella sp.]|nr:hypothetical protein [Fuerstiella sp.]